MPLLIRKKQFAIKIETTEGEAVALVGADVKMAVEELDGTFEPEPQERNPLRADLSPDAHIIGITMGAITGRTELKPGAIVAVDDPPFHDVLLALGLQQRDVVQYDTGVAPSALMRPGEHLTGSAAGRGLLVRNVGAATIEMLEEVAFAASETVTGDTSGATVDINATPANVTIGKGYHPTSSPGISYTAAVFMDGIKKTIFGSRGDGSLEVAGSGQLGYLSYTLNGASVTPVDAALLTGTVIPVITPETFLGAVVEVTEGIVVDQLCIDSFAMAFNNTVARRLCADAATGIKSFIITDRAPTITIDPEVETEAIADFFAKFAGAKTFSFYSQIGSSPGKRTIIAAANCQYTALGNADREGIATYSADLRLTRGARPAGDDEFIIAFT